MKELITLSDNTKIYDIKSFENLLKETIKDSKNSVLLSDLILFLLYAKEEKPVFGRTMFMKQIFLTTKEILDKNSIEYQEPKFVPYTYGPYSFNVTDTITNLNFMGYIEIFGKKNSRKERFLITNLGKNKIKEKFQSLPENLKNEIVDKRISWDQLGTNGILRYVYAYYPDYKENSKIKGKFKDIKWGKAKG